jgi:hypothetical protein
MSGRNTVFRWLRQDRARQEILRNALMQQQLEESQHLLAHARNGRKTGLFITDSRLDLLELEEILL